MDARARVLYLTNMQAQLFKGETVPMMLDAFAVRAPSLVINLMDSAFYPVDFENDFDLKELSEQERADYSEYLPHNVCGSSHSFASREEAARATRTHGTRVSQRLSRGDLFAHSQV